MARRFLLSCGVLAALLASGCGSKSGNTAAIEHDEYTRTVETRLAALDAETDSLKSRVQVANDSVKVHVGEALDQLKQQREKTKLKLDELRAAAADKWDDTKQGLAVELDSLDAKFDRARQRLQ